MKKLTLGFIVLSFVGFNAVAAIEDDLKNICTIVGNNDKLELRRKITSVDRDYGVRLSDYYTGVTCGGKTLLSYADSNGALDTFELLTKKLNKSLVDKEIQDWAGSTIGLNLLQERSN